MDFTSISNGFGTIEEGTNIAIYSKNADYDNGTSYRNFSQINISLNANTSCYIKFRGYNNNSALDRLTVRKNADIWHKLQVDSKTIYIQEPKSGSSRLEARVAESGASMSTVYTLIGNTWARTSTVAYIPSGTYVASLDEAEEIQDLNLIDDVIVDIQGKADAIKNIILDSANYDLELMGLEDWSYLMLGIHVGIVDSVYQDYTPINPTTVLLNRNNIKSLIFLVCGKSEAEFEEDYYYISAKTETEYGITIAARIAEYGSLGAAATALMGAGIAFTGGTFTFAGTGSLGFAPALAIEGKELG